MKIRNFVLVGLLALVFVLSPVVTNAQTVQELQAQIQALLQQIALLQGQTITYPPGCTSSTGYSTTTGLSCSGTTGLPIGCTSTIGFSPITGQSCSSGSTLPEGCTSPIGYSPTTGLPCFGSGNATTTPAISAVTVISPNGGEGWLVGKTYTIKWNTNVIFPINQTNYVQIALRDENYPVGSPYSQETLVFRMENFGSYTFVLPASLSSLSGGKLSGSKYRVIIYPLDVNYLPDQSDGTFSITQPTNLPPSISGVSGPTTLKTGETGTWSVRASDPENGSLSYAVYWGDEATTGSIAGSPTGPTVQQTATFTHTYSRTGTFYPTFTVTDNAGQSAKTSLSVVVGGGTLGQLYIRDVTPLQTSYNSGDSLSVKFRLVKSDGSPAEQANHYSVDAASYYASSENKTSDGSNISTNVIYLGNGYWKISRPVPSASGNYYLRVVAGCYYEGTCEPGYEGWSQNARVELRLPFSVNSVPQPILTITSSYPPNGAIDARSVSGFKDIVLDFSASGFDTGVGIVSSNPTPISLVATPYLAGATKFQLSLSRPLSGGERVTIIHNTSKSKACLGFLPGDVNGDGTTSPADQLDLIDALNGVKKLPIYSTDIDRSGVTAPADLLAFTDLFNAGWNGKSLPPCPSAGLGSISSSTQMASILSSLNATLQALQRLFGR